MWRRRPFTPDGAGGYRLQFRAFERDLLRRLPGQALGLIDDRHPTARRLFPVAYPHDEKAQADYQRSVGSELLAARRRALETLAATVDQPVIDQPQLELWLQALEALRLLLGTQLDVTEDMEEPAPGDDRAPAFALYHYLSALQDEAVQVLTETLPDVAEEPDELLDLLADGDLFDRLADEELWGLGGDPGEPGSAAPGGSDTGGGGSGGGGPPGAGR